MIELVDTPAEPVTTVMVSLENMDVEFTGLEVMIEDDECIDADFSAAHIVSRGQRIDVTFLLSGADLCESLTVRWRRDNANLRDSATISIKHVDEHGSVEWREL